MNAIPTISSSSSTAPASSPMDARILDAVSTKLLEFVKAQSEGKKTSHSLSNPSIHAIEIASEFEEVVQFKPKASAVAAILGLIQSKSKEHVTPYFYHGLLLRVSKEWPLLQIVYQRTPANMRTASFYECYVSLAIDYGQKQETLDGLKKLHEIGKVSMQLAKRMCDFCQHETFSTCQQIYECRDPKNFPYDHYIFLARSHGKTEEALSAYKQALRHSQASRGLFQQIFTHYAKLGDTANLHEEFKTSQRYLPNDAIVALCYVSSLCLLHEYKEAKQQYIAAMENPVKAKPFNEYEIVLWIHAIEQIYQEAIAQGDYAFAEMLYQKQMETTSKNAIFIKNLRLQALGNSGKYQEAHKLFDAIMEEKSANESTYLEMMKLTDKISAFTQFSEAFSLALLHQKAVEHTFILFLQVVKKGALFDHEILYTGLSSEEKRQIEQATQSINQTYLRNNYLAMDTAVVLWERAKATQQDSVDLLREMILFAGAYGETSYALALYEEGKQRFTPTDALHAAAVFAFSANQNINLAKEIYLSTDPSLTLFLQYVGVISQIREATNFSRGKVDAFFSKYVSLLLTDLPDIKNPIVECFLFGFADDFLYQTHFILPLHLHEDCRKLLTLAKEKKLPKVKELEGDISDQLKNDSEKNAFAVMALYAYALAGAKQEIEDILRNSPSFSWVRLESMLALSRLSEKGLPIEGIMLAFLSEIAFHEEDIEFGKWLYAWASNDNLVDENLTALFIKDLCKVKDFERAKEIYESAPKKTDTIYNMMIFAAGYNHDIDLARKIFLEAGKKGLISLGTVDWYINALVACGNTQEALQIFEDAEHHFTQEKEYTGSIKEVLYSYERSQTDPSLQIPTLNMHRHSSGFIYTTVLLFFKKFPQEKRVNVNVTKPLDSMGWDNYATTTKDFIRFQATITDNTTRCIKRPYSPVKVRFTRLEEERNTV